MSRLILPIVVCTIIPVATGGETPQFFASRVVAFDPGPGYAFFPDSALALGGPRGVAGGDGSLDVVSLGVQGEIVLGFAPGQALTDGPDEDLIVFENAVAVSGPYRFAELVRVGVSTDGQEYAFFPTWCGLTTPAGPYTPINTAMVGGFAGTGPVYANVGGPGEPGNGVDPFDPSAAGGDAFDLSALAGDPLVIAGAVDLGRIYYVKLVDVLGDGSERDDFDNPVYDPTGNMNLPPENYPTSADIDAISVVNALPPVLPGDANRDGEVGIADLSAVADNYGMNSGATWEHGDLNADAAVGIADLSAVADNYGSHAAAETIEKGIFRCGGARGVQTCPGLSPRLFAIWPERPDNPGCHPDTSGLAPRAAWGPVPAARPGPCRHGL